ncbi:TonB-linked SusC/RagA family outer membrane protein [Pedobacter sp. W3I1]|uniref:SusC/RagA family TonB-linked outer membrane protein n=1 Tax=Pedobacter sp. W3I1 TaxID=3042291 RepID=UPI0027806DCF|nr:TonB-dependent receptor [Pedobacter sp. W3I1]MDQ0638456.1 TonB-linked SusC/RagA family outer membrane protein [Pedobacter sp. W3I1]
MKKLITTRWLAVFFMLAFLHFNTVGFAQNSVVSGKIIDEAAKPLPGVSVLVKGSKISTVSELDGSFKIAATSNATLLVSFVGMETQEINLGGRTTLNISMKASANVLDEMVVVGYGTQKRTDVTSSITRADMKNANQLPVQGVEQALQGRAAGVQVVNTNGLPGSAVMVRIRGVGTVNNNEPLYVVDGIPVSGLNFLTPADIESVDILKDASAAAIYGNRAANGVVLITTKKGKGKTTISFDSYYASSKPWRDYKPAGRDEYLYMSKVVNGESSTEYKKTKAAYDQGNYTNWWDETVNSAPTQNYNVAVSGSTDKIHYSLNGSYYKQEGMVKPSGYERFTFRSNADYKVRDWWKIGENFSLSNEKNINTLQNILGLIKQYDPLIPVLDLNKDQADPYNKFAVSNTTFGSSPLARLARIIGQGETLRAVGNVYTDINLTKNIVLNSSFGLDVGRPSSWSFVPTYFMSASDKNELRSASAGSSKNNHWVSTQTMTWTPKIGDHSFNVLAGASFEKSTWRSLSGTSYGQPSNDPKDWYIDAGTSSSYNLSGNAGSSGLNSYFGRLIYNFKDKYLFNASIRHDGTSAFSKDSRWGTFPAASLGWVVSKEQFWGKETAKWFSNLKIRGGWGQLGNQNVPGANNYATYIAGGVNRRFVLGDGTIVQGYAMDNLGNSLLHWETTRQVDAAVDFGFFNNALTFTAEYYTRKTKDMLVSLPVADVFGVSSPIVNIGSVRNRGFDFEVNYNGNIGSDFKYTIGGNLSAYKNMVVDLGLGAPYVDEVTGSRVTGFSRTAVGQPIGQFYGYKTAGIFQSQAEVDGYIGKNGKIQPNARPGDFRFQDINGDGLVNDGDKTTIGNPHPDFTYGFNTSLNYKNFDIVLYVQGSAGNDNINLTKYTTNQPLGFDNIQAGVAYAAWTPENHSNTQPIMSKNDPNNNFRTSDFYVEDASYIRLKTVQLGYTLPTKFISKASFSSVRIYVAAQNLFTITDYSGLDPEVGPYSVDAFNTVVDNARMSRLMGADFGAFPNPRTLQVGLSVKF